MDPIKPFGFLKEIIGLKEALESLFPKTPDDALNDIVEKTLSQTELRFQKGEDIYLSKTTLRDFLNQQSVDEYVKLHFADHTIDYKYLAEIFEKNYGRFVGEPSIESILKYLFRHVEVNLMPSAQLRDLWIVTQNAQLMHNIHAIDNKLENIEKMMKTIRNETIFDLKTPPIKRLAGELNYASDFSKIGMQETISSEQHKRLIIYTSPHGLEKYWEDLLGPEFAFGDPQESKQKLFPGALIKLQDVLLTEWFPVVPGSAYQRALFETNLRDMQVRLGSIRFNNLDDLDNPERSGWKLLSAHFVNQFVAHNEVCRGIPVIIKRAIYNSEVFQYFINCYGAVHIEELNGRLLQIPQFYEDRLRTMYDQLNIPFIKGTYRSPLALTIFHDSHEEVMKIAHEAGTPDPLLGTAWTVWDKHEEFDWHYFWIGVDDHGDRLEDAVTKIENRSPVDSKALTDFDQLRTHFPEAKIWPRSIAEPS